MNCEVFDKPAKVDNVSDKNIFTRLYACMLPLFRPMEISIKFDLLYQDGPLEVVRGQVISSN